MNVGGTATVRITVQSNVDEQLQVSHVGVNFDWMASSGFYGPDLSSNPAVIPSNGNYTTPPFIVQIPTNVAVGAHTYYVGVDGIESSNQNAFYWNSTVVTIQVLPANTTGTTSIPTANPILSPTSTPNPSPTIPEFPAIAILTIFLALSLFAITLLSIRKRRISKI